MKWCIASSYSLVPRPHPVCVYRFQYTIMKTICAGVGFGSGTETNPVTDWSKVKCVKPSLQGLCWISNRKCLHTQTSFCHTFTFLYSPSSHPALPRSSHPPSLHPPSLHPPSSHPPSLHPLSSHPPSLHPPPHMHPSPHTLPPDTQDYGGVWYVPWRLDRDNVVMPVHQRYTTSPCHVRSCEIMWSCDSKCVHVWFTNYILL